MVATILLTKLLLRRQHAWHRHLEHEAELRHVVKQASKQVSRARNEDDSYFTYLLSHSLAARR